MADKNAGSNININMDGSIIITAEDSRATGASSEKLKRLALGDWVLVKINLDTFKPSFAQDGDMYHAIMIGRCLQQDECDEDEYGPAICLDRITLVKDK
jgi:hypothetical protein